MKSQAVLLGRPGMPVLLGLVFLLTFLPMLFYYRTRLWRLQRRLELTERNIAQSPMTPPPPSAPPAVPKPSNPFGSQP